MPNRNAHNKVANVAQHGYESFRTDMFGRIKVSEPYTLFDSTHRYERSGDYSEEISGGGTVTYLDNESSLSLNVGTASGDKVTLESYKVFPYQPGKSLQVLQTFVFAPPKANLRQRAGYFSRQNGFYLEQDGSAVYLVKRSYISGSVVETRVPQSQWNIDALDGDGPSDIVLDLSKAQIMFSEYEWLGVGSVRLGFAIDGYFIPVHIFNHANSISSVYITTASLPVRYEIENTGATASASSFKQICVSVVSNGGYSHDESKIFAAVRETEVNVGTTRYPLVAIRMRSGRTDSVVMPTLVDIASGTAGAGIWEIIENPTTLNGGTWSTTNSSKNVEYSINMTTISGGTVLRRRLFSTSNQSSAESSSEDLATWDLQLGRTNSDTPVSDVYVLTFRTFKSTMDMQGMLGWHDLL
jgi:hypothetical protein